MKILKFFVVLVLVILPLGEIVRIDLPNNIVLKPLDLTVGFTAIIWLILSLKTKKFGLFSFKKNKINKLILFCLLFIATGIVSLFVNLIWLKTIEFFVALLYLLRWSSYALMLLIISSFDNNFKKKIKKILFIDGLVFLLFGFLQYFFLNSLKRFYYFGWDEHMHRMFSTFLDPNFAGGFFTLYLIYIAGIFFKTNERKKKHLIVILIFTLIAIFLTFSRASLLMFLVSSIVFLALINKKKIIITAILSVVVFSIVISPKSYDENMNLFREASSKARIENYQLALRVITDRPLLGVGFNSYRYTKSLYGLNHDWVDAPSHADAGVDNSFLFVLATTGIVGGLFYGGIWYLIIRKSIYLFKKKRDIFIAVVISSICGIFVHSFFMNSLFFAPIMLWVWVLIALMDDFS